VVEAERRASIMRPIVSARWRPTNRNPAQTQSSAEESASEEPSLLEPLVPTSDLFASEGGSIAVSSIFCAGGKGCEEGE